MVWTRSLTLVFGVGVVAATAVLTSFMAGLALGSWVIGRMSDRIRRPLAWYGVLQIGIAVAALLLPLGVERIQILYVNMHGSFEETPAVVGVVRFLLSLLLVNPCADVLRWALTRGDLEKARLALREQVSSADLFGLPRRTVRAETVREAMVQAQVAVVAQYGVRVFADYLPAEKLADPEFFARLLELEAAAATLHPYRLIARYIQLLGRKPEALQA